MVFQYGWMGDPVYTGDYPPAMRKALGSLLPSFTKEQSEMLNGTLDYFAVRGGRGRGHQGPPPRQPRQSQTLIITTLLPR
jgi:hypothetical protein